MGFETIKSVIFYIHRKIPYLSTCLQIRGEHIMLSLFLYVASVLLKSVQMERKMQNLELYSYSMTIQWPYQIYYHDYKIIEVNTDFDTHFRGTVI